VTKGKKRMIWLFVILVTALIVFTTIWYVKDHTNDDEVEPQKTHQKAELSAWLSEWDWEKGFDDYQSSRRCLMSLRD